MFYIFAYHMEQIYNKFKGKDQELEFKINNATIFFALLQEHFKLKSVEKTKGYEEIYNTATDTFRLLESGDILKKHHILSITESEYKITLNEESAAKELPKNAAFTFIRYKERNSYMFPASTAQSQKFLKEWRVDYTLVKTTTTSNRKAMSKMEFEAELELEYIDGGSGKSIRESIEAVIALIMELHPLAKIRQILDKRSIHTISQIANFPRTLTMRNLHEITGNNYYVAEKTDGERVMLLQDGKHLYGLRKPLILFDVKSAKKAAETVSLYDTEYVAKLDKYFVFDVLISTGKSVVNLPYTERLTMIANSDIINKSTIVAKKQHAADDGDIFKTSDKVYHAKYPYHVDGLIYTSATGGYYTPVYKWKPTSELTIDFLVRIVHDTNSKNGSIKTVNLYASLLQSDMQKFGFKFEKDYQQLFPFIKPDAHIFPYKFIPYQTAEIDTKATDIPVLDNTIIEFNYDVEEENKFRRWKPYRLRKDKTLEYLEGIKNHRYIGGPNEFKIAKEQLDAILHPIPEAVIFGQTHLSNYSKGYYKNHKTNRNNVRLYNFNNYVKTQLFKKYTATDGAVMDLAAGRGGDLCKHIMNGVKYLLHVDADADALEEAKRRYEEYKVDSKKCAVEKINTEVEFMQVDLLDKATIKNIDKVVGDKQFNLISCNFAIHYFLNNKKDFDKIYAIVDKYLAKGGYFLFTGLDGKAVFEELAKQASLVYKKDDDIIYQINKLYKNNKIANFGQEIDVFVKKIGIKHKENILNFEAIQREFGYKLVATDSFATMLEEWRKKAELNDDERRLISLERYMVLQKA